MRETISLPGRESIFLLFVRICISMFLLFIMITVFGASRVALVLTGSAALIALIVHLGHFFLNEIKAIEVAGDDIRIVWRFSEDRLITLRKIFLNTGEECFSRCLCQIRVRQKWIELEHRSGSVKLCKTTNNGQVIDRLEKAGLSIIKL